MKKIVLAIIILLFVAILLFVKFSDFKLTKRSVLLNAKTIGWGTSSYMGLNLEYEFYYNGKKIFGSDTFNDFRGDQDFVNKNFPVMYEPKIGSAKLLIQPSDFKRFGLNFPDSLKWVLKYSNNKVGLHNTKVDRKGLAKKANLLYEQNNWQKAIIDYDTLILLDSTKGGYYFKRGFCKSMLLDITGAISDYKLAIARNYSEKASAYLNIGVLFRVSLIKPDSAIIYYNECLKIEPRNEKATREKIAAIDDLRNLKQ